MSLILKGIDLPKDRDYVNLSIYSNGDVYEQTENGFYFRINADAIQIPKGHGRLIDGDELLTKYEPWLHAVPFINNTDVQLGKRVVLIDIVQDLKYSAPTIVEAEE